jgi:hypothetical protein
MALIHCFAQTEVFKDNGARKIDESCTTGDLPDVFKLKVSFQNSEKEVTTFWTKKKEHEATFFQDIAIHSPGLRQES